MPLSLLGLALHPRAGAQPRPLGSHDVATVFYISKSDDRNRVDYGIHLDANCGPRGGEPIFHYWRRFEPGQPRFGELSYMDRRAYGIRSQRVATRSATGNWVDMRMDRLPNRRFLVLTRRNGSTCEARVRTRIAGQDAWLDHVFLQVRNFMSIAYARFHGVTVEGGEPVQEIQRP